MSRKNVIDGFALFSKADMTQTLTNSTSVKYHDKSSIHISWVGTSPSGTVTVNARNGDTRAVGNADGWYPLSFGAPITISGNSGDHQLIFLEVPFTDIQLIYTPASGTGTINARIVSKSVGA